MTKKRNPSEPKTPRRGRPRVSRVQPSTKSQETREEKEEKDAKETKKKARQSRPPKRDSRGRVLPGESINPKGRPKGSVSLRAMLNEMLREGYGKGKDRKTHARACVEALLALAEAGDTKALQLALEHNSGKPVQAVVDLTPGNRLEHVSDETLERLLNGGPKAVEEAVEEADEDENEDSEDSEEEEE